LASIYDLIVDTYQTYHGTDENGIVGTVAPGATFPTVPR
jgi:hypothetical protein